MEHIFEPTESDDKITIVVLEDNSFTRAMISNMISHCPQFLLVGEAETGEEALTLVDQLRPDILLADIRLPGIDGIETVRCIRANWPTTKAIMLTSHDTDEDLFQSFSAGADGYITKAGLKPARLELAVKSVDEGSVWLDPKIASRVLESALGSRLSNVAPISSEEHEMLERVAHDPCESGICSVDPAFLENLQRFSGNKTVQEQKCG